MFIAALFTVAKLWKQPRFPTINEWIKKMWYLYTMEFYSSMKKNEILSFKSKWMEQHVLARMWGKRNPNPLLVGMQTGTTTLDKNLEAS
jgi:hypothetical protein